MDHGTPSAAYCVREKPRSNVNTAVLAQLDLGPGPWLERIKDPAVDPEERVQVGGNAIRFGELREQLLRTAPGESIAYLTDFRLDSASEEQLVSMLEGCTTIVCEYSFRNVEQESAERTFHMVSADVARLAARVRPGKLIL